MVYNVFNYVTENTANRIPESRNIRRYFSSIFPPIERSDSIIPAEIL